MKAFELEVSWGDLDPATIVFYPNFFAWADAAAHRLFRAVGLPLDRLLATEKLSFGLVACSAEFHAPVRQGERLRCRSTVGKIGARSLELVHVFARGRRRVTTIREVRVCMDFSRPKRLAARDISSRFRSRLARAAR